jgi:phosphatidylserine/phosphatidylglycerophosphate/cardiolipin synthase-like enzyme
VAERLTVFRLPRVAGRLLALALLILSPAVAASQRFAAEGEVEVLFTPRDEAEAALVSFIGEARHSIHVQSYIFTSKRIADALVAARQRGVDVQVLADGQMNRKAKGNALAVLLAAKVPVAMETAYNAAHNKLILVDAEGPACSVLTGSYNFTWSAQNRNAENILILRGHCALAKAYLANWQSHQRAATPLRSLPFSFKR